MNDGELLQLYANLFVNHKTDWFRQWVDAQGTCNYARRSPGTKNYMSPALAVVKHLNGELTASWPAHNGEGISKWCCWDSDFEHGHISAIIKVLKTMGFYPLRESVRSGRDGHLWLLWDSPIQAANLIRFNQEVLAHARVPMKAEHPEGVEFFPASATRFSQVRGPLGIHRKPGAGNMRGWFEGCEQDVRKQLEWLASQPLNSSKKLGDIVHVLKLYDAQHRQQYQAPTASSRTGERVNFLELIPASLRRWNSKDWLAQCPACAAVGQDTHRDNLRISPNGIATCVEGGAGQGHTFKEILAALRN